MRTISDRLREERDATGLSQQALADRCGISLRSQQNYEKGDRSPDAEYLAQLTAQSIDVLYILTGSRSANSFSLDAGERVLIDSYRRCGEQARRNLLQTAALLGAGMAGNSQDSAQISVSAAGGYAAGRDMAINTPTRKKK